MNLEIKHLAPYLPYGLQYIDYGYEDHPIMTLKTLRRYENGKGDFDDDDNVCMAFKDMKPLLNPLSMLDKEIEYNGEKFVPLVELRKSTIQEVYFSITVDWEELRQKPHWIIEKLISWHFDVFNLIPQSLALDKTKIQP